MIHFDFIWALIALPLPLLVYWLPAKKQIQAAPLRMPTVIKGVQAQDFVANCANKNSPIALSAKKLDF